MKEESEAIKQRPERVALRDLRSETAVPVQGPVLAVDVPQGKEMP